MIKWQAMGHKKHIDLETSRFRAIDPDLAYPSQHLWGDRTRPVFGYPFWTLPSGFVIWRYPFVVTFFDTQKQTPAQNLHR